MHNYRYFFFFLSITLFATAACDTSNDSGPDLSGESKTYELATRSSSGVSGSATLEELTDGSTQITLDLDGTPSDGNHPAHIHQNSASVGGPIVVTFATVDGATGMSQTQIESTDEEMNITYSDILDYDGYVNVHLSTDDLSVVSQGNIGINAGS